MTTISTIRKHDQEARDAVLQLVRQRIDGIAANEVMRRVRVEHPHLSPNSVRRAAATLVSSRRLILSADYRLRMG